MQLYCQLMEQLKWRIDSVLVTLLKIREEKHFVPTVAAAEFCLLQCRFSCELIALGCIAVHTDIPQTKRLQKMWNADLIMSAFEKLKPSYFPVPVRDVVNPDGMREIVDHVDGALTKEELLSKYNFFGGMLHAGTFSNMSKPRPPKVYDLAIVQDFVDQMIKLLNAHTYKLYEGRKLVRVIMRNVTDNKVWWNEFEAVGSLK